MSEAAADDAACEATARGESDRKWLAAAVKIIEAYSHEPTRDGAVQSAMDSLITAACARAKRILRSDLES